MCPRMRYRVFGHLRMSYKNESSRYRLSTCWLEKRKKSSYTENRCQCKLRRVSMNYEHVPREVIHIFSYAERVLVACVAERNRDIL